MAPETAARDALILKKLAGVVSATTGTLYTTLLASEPEAEPGALKDQLDRALFRLRLKKHITNPSPDVWAAA